MTAIESIQAHKNVPVNVLFYRELFAVPQSDSRSEARKKIIKYLKELGVEQIKPIGQEKFVSKSEVERVTEELFTPSSISSKESYSGTSSNAQKILKQWQ